MPKRKFGVSISDSLAESLDNLCNVLGVDRSSVVERAIGNLIVEYSHHLVSHECLALLAIVCSEEENIQDILRDVRDIDVTQIHNHRGNKCTQVIIASGPSDKIAELYSKLNSIENCRVKYMALHDI